MEEESARVILGRKNTMCKIVALEHGVVREGQGEGELRRGEEMRLE